MNSRVATLAHGGLGQLQRQPPCHLRTGGQPSADGFPPGIHRRALARQVAGQAQGRLGVQPVEDRAQHAAIEQAYQAEPLQRQDQFLGRQRRLAAGGRDPEQGFPVERLPFRMPGMPYGLPVQAHPTARQGGLETPGQAQVAGQGGGNGRRVLVLASLWGTVHCRAFLSWRLTPLSSIQSNATSPRVPPSTRRGRPRRRCERGASSVPADPGASPLSPAPAPPGTRSTASGCPPAGSRRAARSPVRRPRPRRADAGRAGGTAPSSGFAG